MSFNYKKYLKSVSDTILSLEKEKSIIEKICAEIIKCQKKEIKFY